MRGTPNVINHDANDRPYCDTLLVLGRGIENDGTLSDESMHRAEVAARIAATTFAPRVIGFTGGRSWVQVNNGIYPASSEGEAMRNTALITLSGEASNSEFRVEGNSTSTIGNFVNSALLIDDMRPRDMLGVLTDGLHYKFRRVQYLARLAFPDKTITFMQLPARREYTAAEVREELLVTVATRVIMTGVRRGDHAEIMNRHSILERLNNRKSGANEQAYNS